MSIASNRDSATTAKPEFMHLRTVAGAILFIAIAFKFLKHLPIWLLLLTAPVWLVIGIISCLCLEVAARWWYDNRVNAESDKHDQRPWTRRRPVLHYTPDVNYASSLGYESQEDKVNQGGSAVMTLLHIILNLIRQDFILPWYSRISTSNTFPEELDKTLLASISGLEERFKRLDIPQLLVARVLPHLTSHMHAYREVEPFLFPTTRTASSTQSTVDPAPILQSHRKTPLHPALPAPALANPMPSVESHLKRKVEVLLRAILPERDRQSKTVMIIAREVVTCAVMMPIVEMLADPDFWNRMLDQQADKHLQERQVTRDRVMSCFADPMKLPPHNRQQVHQLRAALESAAAQQPGTIRQRSSMPTISITDPASPVRTPRANREKRATSISMHTDTRSFDAFLKSISTIRNVTEAKRLRNDIEREIRQVQARLEHEESKVRDNRAKDKAAPAELKRLSSYQNRLQSARGKVDRKINKLNGTSPIMESTTGMGNIESEINSKEGPSLRDILSNPSPLSFYMEFMDRRNQARLVQFWLTVESFKNPLEEAESSEDEDGMGSFRLSATMQRLDSAAFATMKEDVGMIWSMFVDPKTVAEPVPLRPKLFENIRALVEADESNKVLLPLILEQARKSTFKGQKEVYETMLEDHFPAFRKTDLYRKAVIDLDKAAKKGSQVVQLGPDVASASLVAQETATSRQGSMSPPGLTSSASFGQTRWLNQLVGFSGMRFKEPVSESPPQTPTAPRVRKRLSGLQPIFPRVEPSPPSPEVNRPFVRSRSWSIDSNALPTGMSTPSRLDGSRQVLGFLIGEEEPQDDIGRSALFTIEDVPNDDRPTDYQEDVHDDEELMQVERMEAIQAALTSIIQRDEVSRGFPSKSEVRPRTSIDSASHAPSIASMDQNHQYDQWDPLGVVPKSPVMSEHSRPSFGTSYSRPSVDLGLGSSPNSVAFLQPKKVFDDTEEEKQDFLHRSLTSQSVPEMLAQRNPSIDGEPSLTPLDAQLSVEIARLGDLLVRLDEQDRILDRMIRAAELTGKESELYLLSRSQSDLRRELRATRFRKLQYEQQEIDYRLDPQRTKLSIPSATILAEEAGKQIVRYVVEIQQYSMEGDFLQAWVVAKRYNEFWDLQHALKASPVVGRELKARGLDVPSKKLLPKLTDSFVEGRRVALQTYMQGLLHMPSACQHPALKAFLSHSRVALSGPDRTSKPKSVSRSTSLTVQQDLGAQSSIVKSLYHQVTSSLDDIFLKPSMIDVMAEKLNRQAVDIFEAWDAGVTQIGHYGLELGSQVLSPYALRALRSPSLQNEAFESPAFPFPSTDSRAESAPQPAAQQPSAQPQAIVEETGFTTPITDFLVEVFGLKNGDWLRKQALVIVMQQLLGSTIERKVRDGINSATSKSAIEKYLESFKDGLWPGGKKRPSSAARTEAEKIRSKMNAGRKIQALIPDVAANMIGRSNAQRAARQAFGAAQIKLLNLDIILTILDEIFAAMFPEAEEGN